ncbi:vacuolar segregation protein pep7 [Magnaporthiopsis poae ATCC 64411]|uniref:Vacuolar segregation protein pep7 n=1 Tax=Magnaporthiopsis poae (strain ATCC 64411 / 73-15) TaxID=644358 RepID=A0A0C4EGN7_MAGP6|nr:vacuolar segregation protein pep7 [Magnaporthiopsis poae ATCC 64411]
MSGRKLGGGRILGSGKGLAPPPQPPSAHPSQYQQRQQQQRFPSPGHALPRAASPFAPSDVSTVSSGSQNANLITPPTSSSPLPDFSQDLAANISIGAASPSNAATGELVCPICQEEMMTLLQLNRHIDDMHQELPEVQQDEVKTWFDKQVLKAKRFQPLSLINQKLRGLEVFESNEDSILAQSSGLGSSLASSAGNAAPGLPRVLEPAVVDPEDLITKKHWQRPSGGDSCTDPTCDRRMGPLSGGVNCRKCGRIFCEEHTMYQMRLAPRTAAHDPVRGYWYRVCETCYKSREGYNDHAGVLTDHTASFVALRRVRVERQNLEIARLEKRLTKLTQLLASSPEEIAAVVNGSGGGGGIPGTGGLLPASLAGQKAQRKAIEQSVVTWEEDAAVPRCPFCQQEFGSWTFRRHHCRICGRVVCADPQTGCSAEVGLNVATAQQQRASASYTSSLDAARHPGSEKPPGGGGQVSIDVRMCRDCSHTIFAKRDVAESIAARPPDQRAYENLRQFERGIRSLMPSFQRSLMALQPPKNGDLDEDKPAPTHAQIQEAAKIRKRLMDAFAKYNLAARRLRNLPTTNPTQKKLQTAVYAAASTFLHTHMLPLKSVPQMLRSKSSASSLLSASGPGHRRLLSGLNSGSGPNGHLSPLRNGESAAVGDSIGDASSVAGSEVSTAASLLENEEKELRERLVVLEEQRFLVQEMVNGARGSRRFEEVGALSGNLDELDREIATLRKQVIGVEEKWEGLYAAGGGSPR